MVNLLALGPLELWHQERQYKLGSLKERRVLAVLLHARGEPVSVDTLMARVWDDAEPPRTALETMQSYLSRLRGRLKIVHDTVQLQTPSPRLYRLKVDPDSVDLLLFQKLRGQAQAAAQRGEHETALELLRRAEVLWRGEPLAEFTGEWAASTRTRLSEDRRRAREERISIELNMGRHADLIGELHELVAENPLAQQTVGTLMLALYRCGRHGEALELYRSTHRRFAEELGIEPSAPLRELHRRVLEQDPELGVLEGEESSLVQKRSATVVPDPGPASQLPRDIRDFTGRSGELAVVLADSGTDSVESRERALPVTLVHGMPGIGKTAMSVRAAHALSDLYPDGQFYVDLRGFSEEPQYEPAEALAFLLRSSGAYGTAAELPGSLDERTARWRKWTAQHRAIVVLDNAGSSRQVRPLLPAAPTCRAIVTSRNRLAGLDGTTVLFLDVLTVAEGMELFTRIAGAARTADVEALRRVVDACGCHPLALQLLAGRYRHRDSWDLEYLLERLTEARDSLDEFDEGLGLAFGLSYAELDARTQQLLRRLALHPGPDITLDAVAALAGVDTAEARRSVEVLLDGNLIDEPVRARYRLHDLVRAFGRQLCREHETGGERAESIDRLLAYYLRSADRADRLVHPRRRRLDIGRDAGESALHVTEFGDADEASVWLEVERANLLAAARTAAAEAPSFTASFAHVLAPSLKLWGMWDVATELHGTAVAVLRDSADPADRQGLAQALAESADILAKRAPGEALQNANEALALFEAEGDVEGRADALFQKGRAQLAAGQGVLCRDVLAQALRLYREAGSRRGEAETLNVRGVALYSGGKRREAEECFLAMYGIHKDLGDERGQVMALNNLGEIHRFAGRYEKARAHYEQSLAMVQRIGGRQERANIYNNLGIVCQAVGETDQALGYFHNALSSYRAGNDAHGESDTLISLGAAYSASGRHNEALWHYMRAEQIADGIGNPEERLSALVGIGVVQRHLGRYDLAAESCSKALSLAREADIPMGAAEALDGLARVAAVTGGLDAARAQAVEAAELYESLGETEKAGALRRQIVTPGVTGS